MLKIIGMLYYVRVFQLAIKSGIFAGRKGANQAVEAARLGADTVMIGRMGLDAYGDFIERSLRDSGVRIEYIDRDGEFPTGNDAIHVDKNGDNAIVICPPCKPEYPKDAYRQGGGRYQKRGYFSDTDGDQLRLSIVCAEAGEDAWRDNYS